MSRLSELHAKLDSFVHNECIPAEAQWMRAIDESGPRRWETVPDVLEKLQARAKVLGLFNLFLPAEFEGGPGLSLTEYAPLCELMGWSPLAAEACNCSAPGATRDRKSAGRGRLEKTSRFHRASDTGNMEVLIKYGSAEQRARWLTPLLEGRIRSAFLMTEPDVASSDGVYVVLDGVGTAASFSRHRNPPPPPSHSSQHSY